MILGHEEFDLVCGAIGGFAAIVAPITCSRKLSEDDLSVPGFTGYAAIGLVTTLLGLVLSFSAIAPSLIVAFLTGFVYWLVGRRKRPDYIVEPVLSHGVSREAAAYMAKLASTAKSDDDMILIEIFPDDDPSQASFLVE